jgi:hypothetical protein
MSKRYSCFWGYPVNRFLFSGAAMTLVGVVLVASGSLSEGLSVAMFIPGAILGGIGLGWDMGARSEAEKG